MSSINHFGLPRHIPTDIAREVRQRSRFGCVICRTAIYTYEHIDPPFAEASSHDPSAICLLCPSCHALSTKGRLPKTEIARAYREVQLTAEPEAPRDPEFFVTYDAGVSITLGTCSFEWFETIIRVADRPFLSYMPTGGQPPYVVNGEFHDDVGDRLFEIKANEWIGPVDVFDVVQVATRLEVKKAADHTLFGVEKDPSANTIRVYALDMVVRPFHVHLTENALCVGHLAPDGKKGLYFVLYDWQFRGGDAALSLNAESIDEPKFLGVSVQGGGGARIVGTGITIGPGARQMVIFGGMIIVEEHGDLGTSAPESFRRRMDKAGPAFRQFRAK